MSRTRSDFISHSENIRKALWSSPAVSFGASGKTPLGASVLVGAGMSRNAEVDESRGETPPGWAEITRRLVDPLAPNDPDLKEKLLNNTGAVSGFLRIAQLYESEFKRTQLEHFIAENVKDEAISPGRLHQILVAIPWTDIFTTNWDTLLEKAGQKDQLRTYSPILKATDLPVKKQPRIVKLHGTLGVSDKLIFTEEDFRTYPEEHPIFVNTVRQSIMETVLVLIGFSGDDPNFLAWSGWVRDTLKDFSPLIYLVDKFDDDIVYRNLLRDRFIIPLDLGQITDTELNNASIDDPGIAGRLEWWLRYLLNGEQLPLTVWPQQLSSQRRSATERTKQAAAAFELVSQDDKAVPEQGFFSSSLHSTTVTPQKLDDLNAELSHVRMSYRDWVIMPPDARDELYAYLEEWRRVLALDGTELEERPPIDADCKVSRFLRHSIAALLTGEPKESLKAFFSINRQNGAGPRDGDLSDEEIETVRLWIGDNLFDQVATFIGEFVTLSQLALAEWPNGLYQVVGALLDRVDGAEEEASFPTPQDEVCAQLITAYLQKSRERAISVAEWEEVLQRVKQLAAHRQAPTCTDIALENARYYGDRGFQSQIRRIVIDNEEFGGRRLRPQQTFRAAALLDEIARSQHDVSLCQDMRIRAYLDVREKVGPQLDSFEAVSLESWILALEDLEIHSYLADAAQQNSAAHVNVERGIDARLDELKVYRCDPVREFRRARRNVGDTHFRRQSLLIFDRAGIPLVARQPKSTDIEPTLMLDAFIWRAAEAEFEYATELSAGAGQSNPQYFKECDHALTWGIRLLFRYVSHAELAPFAPQNKRYIGTKILPNAADAAQTLLKAAARRGEIDPPSLYLCLDTLDYALSHLDGDESGSARNLAVASTIILGALLLARPSASEKEWLGTIVWAPRLALDAVRHLNKLRHRISLFADLPLEILEIIDVPSWRQLVEALLRLAMSKALRQSDAHPDLIEKVFSCLWEGLTSAEDGGHVDTASDTMVEPFRLVEKPADDIPSWSSDIVGDALHCLDSSDAPPTHRANMIRILDAMRDWNCSFSEEQIEAFDTILLAEFEKDHRDRASLDPWEWLTIDVVRDAAEKEFAEWAFEEAHCIDANTAEGKTESKRRSSNLKWAICHTRTNFEPDRKQIVAVLNWINDVIGAYRDAGMTREIARSSQFTKIFETLFGNETYLAEFDANEIDLALKTLYELHSIDVLVEPAIPYFVKRFSGEANAREKVRRLGSLLRRGLTMAHYPEKRVQFNAAIDATLDWIRMVEQTPNGEMPLPPSALLGALGQALALPEVDRGSRVLQAIRRLLARGLSDGEPMIVADLIADLRYRIDHMLNSKEQPSGDQDTVEKIVLEISGVYEKLRASDGAGDLATELEHFAAALEALQARIHGGGARNPRRAGSLPETSGSKRRRSSAPGDPKPASPS